MGGVKGAMANITHLPLVPVVAAVILGEHQAIPHGSELILIYPQQHLRLRYALGYVEVGMMQGYTAMAIRRAREQGARKLLGRGRPQRTGGPWRGLRSSGESAWQSRL